MKIAVIAKPQSKKVFVEKITQPTFEFEAREKTFDVYKVLITEPAQEGKANKAIIRALATYFEVPPSSVRLVSGGTHKHKIFEIDGV